MSAFSDAVVRVVQAIPRGRVMSYGQVALYVGMPRAARQVGWTLNRLEGVDMPWWRVANNAGRVSIKSFTHPALEQAKLLESEGVELTKELTFDIDRYRYLPSDAELSKWRKSTVSKKVRDSV